MWMKNANNFAIILYHYFNDILTNLFDIYYRMLNINSTN